MNSISKIRREHNGHILKLGSLGTPFDTCQWLFGEPKQRNFCCDPCVAGKPYCQRHCDKAYVPNSSIKATNLLKGM